MSEHGTVGTEMEPKSTGFFPLTLMGFGSGPRGKDAIAKRRQIPKKCKGGSIAAIIQKQGGGVWKNFTN